MDIIPYEEQLSVKKFINEQINREFNDFKQLILDENSEDKLTRNGYRAVNVDTMYGALEIKVPRLRHHSFNPKILVSHKAIELVNNLCTNLYANGLSTRRISNVLQQTLDVSISKSKVSEICTILNDDVEDYFNQDIAKYDFKVIQLDGKYFSVKSMNDKRKSVLISALGITAQGRRILIHFKAYPSECTNSITDFLKELKKRIKQNVETFVVDGNNDFVTSIVEVFPNSSIQRCLVHVIRTLKSSLNNSATIKDKKQIQSDLNRIFFYTNSDCIGEEIKLFFSKWNKYSKILMKNLKDPHIFTYLQSDGFNDVKTTNMIEGIHSQLEQVTVNHKSFSNEQSLYRAIVHEVERYNELASECYDVNTGIAEGFDLQSIVEVTNKPDIIQVTVMFNGIRRIYESIDKLIYSELQKILNSS